MNRGLARRVVFVDRAAARYFLAQVARAVRRGEIEVHAFAIMGTHFHLLLRSPTGQLSAAMQRIQQAFARWFNVRHGRDGPLFRGRFRSRAIETVEDYRGVRAYIERNPVEAGLARQPDLYPFASGRFGAADCPPWLRGLPSRPTVRGLRMAGDEQLAGAPGSMARGRLEQLARLADGSGGLAPRPKPEECLRACQSFHAATGGGLGGGWTIGEERALDALHVAVLRLVAGHSWNQAAHRAGLSIATARRRFREHECRLRSDVAYRRRFAELRQRLESGL